MRGWTRARCCWPSGWAETQGAYRFLSNTKTDWHALLQPHWDCSIERMRPHAVVLNIQDTTELDFNGRQTAGLGPLSYEAQRGMYLSHLRGEPAARAAGCARCLDVGTRAS
jgi:hypothetical protein